MRHLILLLVFIGMVSCTKYIYVPVESKVIEYRDVLKRDSIHLYDSIYIKDKGDTVFLEKYKYLYRDILKIDSFIRTDTIQVPIEVEKELTWWQNTKLKYSEIAFGIFLIIFFLLVIRRL